MDLQRLNVKLYIEDEGSISSEDAFRIFNTWIPQTTDETLIDVADYSHLPHGPQTMLVGHEANYSLDDTDGRLGVMYARKQPAIGTMAERIRDAVIKVLMTCVRIEEESELQGKVRFRGDQCWIVVNDRLHAANDDATLDAIRPELETVLTQMYGDGQFEIERDPGGPKQRFSVRVSSKKKDNVSTLLQKMCS